jgi:hypothetical protein
MTDTTNDAMAKSRELQQWYRDTYGEPEGEQASEKPAERYTSDAKGSCVRLPPEGLTSYEKLQWANASAAPIGRVPEPDVSPEEIGMTPADLARLSGAQRLALANEVLARRRAN